jgi:rubrerythrin
MDVQNVLANNGELLYCVYQCPDCGALFAENLKECPVCSMEDGRL